jgi:hypothetical protein
MVCGNIGSGNAPCRAVWNLHEGGFCRAKLAERCSVAPGIEIRPPAVQGDILDAVRAGVCAIGLIDGHFEFAAPVWHKEILFALSIRVRVLGAANRGALRASECAAFGMVGVGRSTRAMSAGACSTTRTSLSCTGRKNLAEFH